MFILLTNSSDVANRLTDGTNTLTDGINVLVFT